MADQNIPVAGGDSEFIPGELRVQPGSLDFLVVALGASAGGLEAFERFFEYASPSAGIAYVVVSHLSPIHKSILSELLGKYTSMPVRAVEDDTPVEPNHVYVISPGATLTIDQGVLHSDLNPELGSRRSPIDTFFRSLAEDQRDNAVCIILSGTGTDGTLGLRAIKEFGGMAMAQSADTARYDGILRSAISTGLVDHILPIEEMPARLAEHANHLRDSRDSPPALSKQTLAELMPQVHALLRQQTGHDFSRYKEGTVLRRMFRRIQILRIESLNDYVQLLNRDPREVDLLFRDMLIGVTQFFRDPETFDALSSDIIPKLFENKDGDGQVRVSVYGCSSGEEAYSLAIILREQMVALGATSRVQVFATDIDEDALATARAGRYPASALENISPERVRRFFTKHGDVYQVTKEIRELCLFSAHSLIRDPPFSRIDLISCRNVLIYLGAEAQKRVMPVFHYALRRGGYLLLGPSETVNGFRDLFRTIDKKHRIYQRKEQVSHPAFDFPSGVAPRAIRTPPQTAATPMDERNLGRALERLVLEKYAPASAIINEFGRAVYFFGPIGKYLEASSGAPSHDVTTMAREDLRLPLRASIHRAVSGNEAFVEDRIVMRVNGGRLEQVRLTIRPFTEFGDDPKLFLVLFEEIKAPEGDAQGEPQPEIAVSDARARQLEQELRATKEHLQITIEELETSNEELRSTIEEFQSTNEELETSKEELQSLNEELETLNSELNRKVTLLDHANYELQSLFEGSQIATIFLDRELRIKKYTPTVDRIFRLILGDVGRPIADIAQQFVGPDVAVDARAVLESGSAHERELRTTPGNRCYVMRVMPYQPEAGRIDGVVVTFIDVTELKEAEISARDAKLFAESIVATVRSPLVVLDEAFHVRSANPSFCKLFGLCAEDAGARSIFEIGDRKLDLPSVHEALEQVSAKNLASEFQIECDFAAIGTRILVLGVRRLLLASEPALILLTLEDITDRKLAEEAVLRQTRLAQSNAALEQFTYAASHDLREPLRTLTSYTELLQERLADRLDEETRQFMSFIVESSTRMNTLVSGMLEYSRLGEEDSPPGPTDCNALVESALSNLRQEIEETGATVRHHGLPTLLIHQSPLLAIFQNLIDNSIKYRSPERKPEIEIRATRQGREWLFSVRDNGIGIDPAQRHRIFGLFKRLNVSASVGTGIGLAACRRLVERFGGRIWVESELGHGSTFYFVLPE